MESFFRDGARDLKKLEQRLEQAEQGLLGQGKQFVATAGEFENGEDLGAPAGQRAAHDVAVGAGGNVLAIAESVEFIHFGTVYRDDASRFPAPKLNDARPIDLSKERGARGLMFRAALHRETVLLGGFIRAQMAALVAEEQMMGSVGTVAAFASELFGAAGGFGDRPTAFDFSPYLEKVRPIGAELNKREVDYPLLHTAGVDLHDARASYRKFLATYVDKRLGKAKAPGGGVLDSVPLLSGIIPDGFKDVLTVAQQMAFKVFDVHAAFVAEIALRMEPAIERASRAMSIHAIRERSSPMYDPWRLPPHPAPAETKDLIDAAKIEGQIPGAVKPYLENVVGDVGDLLGKANELGHEGQKAIDFLSRGGAYTKGRPYLDMAFQIEPDFAPDRPDWASLKLADALGETAVASFERVVGVQLPKPVGRAVAKICALSAEFLRAVYGKLILLKDADDPTEQEFHRSARDHLVHQVVEALIGMVPDVEKIRALRRTIQGVTVSVEALIARAKEFIAREIGGALDEVVGWAMRDLHGMLMGVRATAKENGALSMEVYLGLLPVLFARMFRNIFFPIWDLLLHQGMGELSKALGFENEDALRMIRMARRQVDLVQKTMEKTSKLLEGGVHLLGKGAKEDRAIIKSMFDLDPLPDAPAPTDPLAGWFPMPERLAEASALRVTDEHVAAVEPALRWKDATDVQAPSEAAALPGGAAGGAGGAGAGGSGAGGSGAGGAGASGAGAGGAGAGGAGGAGGEPPPRKVRRDVAGGAE